MTGDFDLRVYQWGLEGTRGTAVPADTILNAEHGGIQMDHEKKFIKDNIGVRADANRVMDYSRLYQDTLRFPDGYFQVMPMIGNLGIKGSVAGVEQTTGEGDYLYDFQPTLTGFNAPDSGTLEMGDDNQFWEVEFMMIERIKISGVIPQGGGAAEVAIEVGYFGRQLTKTTKTAALSLLPTETMNAKLARLYIDPTWAALGSTEKTGLLREFDVEILTGIHPKFHGDQNKYFTTYGEGRFAVLTNLTFEGNADSTTEWDAWVANTLRVIRLSIDGAAIGGGVNHNLTLDIGGMYQGAIPLDKDDRGNNLTSLIFRSVYDITGDKLFGMSVITDLAAI